MKSVFQSLYVTLVEQKGRKEIFEVLAFSLLIPLYSFHIVMFSLSSDFETTPKLSLVAQIPTQTPATTILFLCSFIKAIFFIQNKCNKILKWLKLLNQSKIQQSQNFVSC